MPSAPSPTIRHHLVSQLRTVASTLGIKAADIGAASSARVRKATGFSLPQGATSAVRRPDDVFDRPATPFVMDFLGNVNVFHGRVEGGQAFWHGVPLAYPDYPHAQSRPARGFT